MSSLIPPSTSSLPQLSKTDTIPPAQHQPKASSSSENEIVDDDLDDDGNSRELIRSISYSSEIEDNGNENCSSHFNQHRQLVLSSLKDGSKIQETYTTLTNLVGSLNDRVEQLLEEHENDFFLAYKSHMYSVQEEQKALKQRVEEAESKERYDAKIQSLTRELEWFMKEALRLDTACKNYKKGMDVWKTNAEFLDEHRKFLEDHLKATKSQNKTLRTAVEKYRHEECPVNRNHDKQLHDRPENAKNSTALVLSLPSSSSSIRRGESQGRLMHLHSSLRTPSDDYGSSVSHVQKVGREIVAVEKKEGDAAEARREELSINSSVEEKYKQTIVKLKMALENERKVVM